MSWPGKMVAATLELNLSRHQVTLLDLTRLAYGLGLTTEPKSHPIEFVWT